MANSVADTVRTVANMRLTFTVFSLSIALSACVGQGGSDTTGATPASTAAETTAPIEPTAEVPTTTEAPATTAPAADGDTVDVFAEDFAFSPSVVTIKVGDSVRWNLSSGSHTTTSGTGSPDGRWDQAIAEEAPVVVGFSEAGEFPYYCRFHADFMSGRVVVEP